MIRALLLVAALLALAAGSAHAEDPWPVDCVAAPGWDEVRCYLRLSDCVWNTAPASWEQCAKL